MNRNYKIWTPLILVSLASFIIALDSSFMNVSISQLVVDLNTNITVIQVIACFYSLITGSLMLITSKLQDIIGKRKIFLLGSIIFGIGALISSISQNTLMLFIGWSILEGIGGALIIPSVISIISGTYDNKKRTIALAISSSVVGIAAAIGPLFGGIVTNFLSWRYGFAIEVIIVICILVFHKRIIDFQPIATKKDFDIIGSVISVVGLILLVSGILEMEKNINISLILMILGSVVLIIFGLFEKNRKNKGKIPLLDMNLLKNRNLTLGMLIRLITNLSLAGAVFVISIFLQSVLKLNAFHTGLNLLPLTIGLLLASIIAPKIAIKLNLKYTIIIGFILAIIGSLLLKSQFELTTKFINILPGMFIMGIGLGFVSALSVDIALKNVPKENENTASGFITTGQTLGLSIGVAIIGCVLVIGAVGGIHDAINIYAPNIDNIENNTHTYFEKLGHVDTGELKHEHNLKEKIVNTIIQDAMKLVMIVLAIIQAIGLVLALALKDRKKLSLKKILNK